MDRVTGTEGQGQRDRDRGTGMGEWEERARNGLGGTKTGAERLQWRAEGR